MSWPRSQARRAAVQALYQWQVTGSNLSEIERQFVEEHGLDKADPELFHELLHEIPARLNEIDAALGVYLDRPIGDVDLVERAVLRIGAYELLYRLDVPFRVILNEAIRYAKEFGSVQGYRFVNGILDRVARQVRGHEIATGSSSAADGVGT